MVSKTPATSPTLDEIRQILRQPLPELRARYGVRSLALFGSYVRGEQNAGSDLDMLVDYEIPPDCFQFVESEDFLSLLSGIKVDLVMKSAMRPRTGKRILVESVPI